MGGAIIPNDPEAPRRCYRVYWPEGEDWLSLLIGAISRLSEANYWAGEGETVELATEAVLRAVFSTLDVLEDDCMDMVGTIKIWPSMDIPTGWYECDGRLLSVGAYPVLFEVLGFTYGGNQPLEFRLPDLRTRVPVGQTNPENPVFGTLGYEAGEVSHVLTESEIPTHNHSYVDRSNTVREDVNYHTTAGAGNGIAAGSGGTIVNRTPFIRDSGGGQAHNNMQPYIVLKYIIKIDA